MKNCGAKKILLITGKFPDVTSDIDGGSIMVSHLIEALKGKCTLDVLFTRKYNTNFINLEGVTNVIFLTNKFRNTNKFLRRLANIEWNSIEISKLIPFYDRVIIIHCSKAFGLENLSIESLCKIILFPMFLTSSYKRSNEIVPCEYTEREQKILNKITKIITPSQSEKNDIKIDYDVSDNRIIVIPRAINSLIKSKVRDESKANKLIYIGSIKKQKRNDEAIVLLSKLKAMGIKSHLYLVGSIQDEDIFSNCLDLINKFGLENDVTFCGVLSQKEIAELLNEMDINISLSLWETFGRGVFEGLCSGLPTVTFRWHKCLSEYTNTNNGISFVHDINSMAHTIFYLCTNPSFYKSQSQNTIKIRHQFSLEKQKRRLIKEIL